MIVAVTYTVDIPDGQHWTTQQAISAAVKHVTRQIGDQIAVLSTARVLPEGAG